MYIWLLLQFIRVMAKGAQCAENGPFFPTTPRMIIQNGIAIDSNILITPDWLYIGLMLGSFFLLVIILALALVRAALASFFFGNENLGQNTLERSKIALLLFFDHMYWLPPFRCYLNQTPFDHFYIEFRGREDQKVLGPKRTILPPYFRKYH